MMYNVFIVSCHCIPCVGLFILMTPVWECLSLVTPCIDHIYDTTPMYFQSKRINANFIVYYSVNTFRVYCIIY